MAAAKLTGTHTSSKYDLTGRRFGRLVVLEYVSGYQPRHTRVWLCRCDCGGEKLVHGCQLKNGHTRSCGCLSVGPRAGHPGVPPANKTHGMSKTPTYSTWKAMHTRCYNTKYRFYHRHGGRGIRVCERWRTFENFLADMGVKPPGTSIDRIDNDGDYKPGNCRWATAKQQRSNSRQPMTVG